MKKWIPCFLGVASLLLSSHNMAEAATYYTSPNGTGIVCTSASPCSLSTANTKPVAGDTIILTDGALYTTTITPTNSGSALAPITYRGQNSSVTVKRADLSGKSYINLENLTFYSTGTSWIDTSPGTASTTHHINISDCTFNSSDLDGTTTMHTFWGIRIYGDYYTIRNNTFLTWYGGDTVQLHGDYGIVENNDFSKNNSGHGSLIIYGNYVIARNNYFRNRWDRALETSGINGEAVSHRLIENNITFDSNWDETYPYPASANDGGDTAQSGTTQMAKIGGSITIWRNNLVVASNVGKSEPGYEYKGIYEMSPYGGAYYWDHVRVYHNTQTLNPYDHGITMGRESIFPTTEAHTTDNVFKNNIIVVPPGKYAFNVRDNVHPFFTHTIDNNILTQPSNILGTILTAQELNDRSNTDAIKHNSSLSPTFINPNTVENAQADASDNTKITMNDFTLTIGSQGKAAGTHLTTIVPGSAGTILKVEDSYYFFDGYGLVPGDEILVTNTTGENIRQTRVMSVVDKNTMTISPAIAVANGDKIYLASYGTTPNIGIVVDSTPSPWDIDGNQYVNFSDLSILLSNFGKVGTRSEGNITGDDNTVNLADLSILLAHFGK